MGIETKDIIQARYGYDERYIKMIEKIQQMIDFYETDQDFELKDIWLERVFLHAWKTGLELRN